MIIDKLSNLKKYASVHPGIGIAFDFINKMDFVAVEEGRYDLPEGVFALVNNYKTKAPADAIIECHQKYIDIQMVMKGEEHFGYAVLDGCEAEPYNEEKDVQELHGEVSLLKLKPNMFAIFFPDDAHQPALQIDGVASDVKKVVFKLPV